MKAILREVGQPWMTPCSRVGGYVVDEAEDVEVGTGNSIQHRLPLDTGAPPHPGTAITMSLASILSSLRQYVLHNVSRYTIMRCTPTS